MTLYAPPTRQDLFDWLGTTDPGAPGDVYDLALEQALEGQRARCVIGPYTPALHGAALRRAARFLAAKGMSLGAFDSGDFGTMYLPRWDAQIEELEMHYRRGGFA
jgi:glycosyltransferase A (GT-A) superfamily protein (DUF2064 family)